MLLEASCFFYLSDLTPDLCILNRNCRPTEQAEKIRTCPKRLGGPNEKFPFAGAASIQTLYVRKAIQLQIRCTATILLAITSPRNHSL